MPFNQMQITGKKLVFKNWDWSSKMDVKNSEISDESEQHYYLP